VPSELNHIALATGGTPSGGATALKQSGKHRARHMGVARPVTLKLRHRVSDVGDAPVIEDVAVRRGQFGGSREILRGDERNRQPGHKAQQSNDGVAAFRANPSPQRGWRAIAAEFDRPIVWQGDRAGPEICDVGERLAVKPPADRAVAEKTAGWLPRNGKARSATDAGAILVHRALQLALFSQQPNSHSRVGGQARRTDLERAMPSAHLWGRPQNCIELLSVLSFRISGPSLARGHWEDFYAGSARFRRRRGLSCVG
jgi:hypothetical protein